MEIETDKTTKNDGDKQILEDTAQDDEDDCEGFFLEPVTEVVNMAEKIAQANKELFEEEKIESKDEKLRKVQFSKDLVAFEPDTDYESTTSDHSLLKISEELEESNNKILPICNEKVELFETSTFSKDDLKNDLSEEIEEEIIEDVSNDGNCFEKSTSYYGEENYKVLHILLPQDENPTGKSIIEEVFSKDGDSFKETADVLDVLPDKTVKSKLIRPKSASNVERRKSQNVSKITPNLNCASKFDRRSWQVTKIPSARQSKSKVEKNDRLESKQKNGAEKTINSGTYDILNVFSNEKLKKCKEKGRNYLFKGEETVNKNNTTAGLMTRNCYVIKLELPHYNGLRSEYGLSAEQLQQKKQSTLLLRYKKKQDRLKKEQEILKRKIKNEEVFQKWLLGKNKRQKEKEKKIKPIDTLARSDIYIQTHASYAKNKQVPYAVKSDFTKKMGISSQNVQTKKKTISEKINNKISLHHKGSVNIYFGVV